MLHVSKFDFEQNGDTVYLSLGQTMTAIYGAHSEHWDLRSVLTDLKEQGKTIGCPEEVYNELINLDWFAYEPVEKFMQAIGAYSDLQLTHHINNANISLPAKDVIINVRDGLLPADKYVEQQKNRLEKLRLKEPAS